MKRKWQISVVLCILFLEAWTVAEALAQYTCPSATTCQQQETYCSEQCGSGCSGTGTYYTGKSINVLGSPGPCSDYTTSQVECYSTKNCNLYLTQGYTCTFDYNGFYCEGPITPGNWCQKCTDTTWSLPVTVTSYTCSNCSG